MWRRCLRWKLLLSRNKQNIRITRTVPGDSQGIFLLLDWFWANPLKWQVLKVESSCMTLISLYDTADRLYHDQDEDTSWENCSLRRWLIQTFLQNTFSSDEIAQIIPFHVPFEGNDEYKSIQADSSAAETVDQVFILSAGEYRSYFGKGRLTWSCRNMRGMERQCCLRNSGSDLRKCSFLGLDGRIYWSGSIVNNVRHAVRPVIVVRL